MPSSGGPATTAAGKRCCGSAGRLGRCPAVPAPDAGLCSQEPTEADGIHSQEQASWELLEPWQCKLEKNAFCYCAPLSVGAAVAWRTAVYFLYHSWDSSVSTASFFFFFIVFNELCLCEAAILIHSLCVASLETKKN